MLCRVAITSTRNFSVSPIACGPPTIKMWIDGKPVESNTSNWIELTNPATNEVIGLVPKSTQEEMKMAADSAKQAFQTWRKTSILTRQQTMFNLQHLIKRDLGKLAKNITIEQGKTIPDAEGDVNRGLQVGFVHFNENECHF